jgi:Ca2+ transporting ATPase
MFIFSKADANDIQIDQFEVTGSTYEPKGDILFNGSKFNCSDRSGLVELAECAALCNDSALDYNEVSFSFILSYTIPSFFLSNRQRKYMKKLVKQQKLH